jgi:hypothetical protein
MITFPRSFTLNGSHYVCRAFSTVKNEVLYSNIERPFAKICAPNIILSLTNAERIIEGKEYQLSPEQLYLSVFADTTPPGEDSPQMRFFFPDLLAQ